MFFLQVVALQKAVCISRDTSYTAFTFSVKILVTTEQVFAAFTLAVCWYPPLVKHHHRCNDFDDDKQQQLCSLVLTLPCRTSPMSRAPVSKSGDVAYNWYTVRHQSSFYVEHQEALYPIYTPTHFISTYVTHRSWFLDMSLGSYYKGILSCLTVPSSEPDIAPFVINTSLYAICPLHLARTPWIQILV